MFEQKKSKVRSFFYLLADFEKPIIKENFLQFC